MLSIKTEDGGEFEAVLLTPPNFKDRVLLYSHGGPHSAFTHRFAGVFCFLLHLGCALILPNYRGSIGRSQDSAESLPGKIGTQDVSDCMAALDAAVKELSESGDATNLQIGKSYTSGKNIDL